MPVVTAETFRRHSLMAGTARELQQETVDPEGLGLWNRDFSILTDDLRKLVDLELGNDLAGEKDFYTAALQVARGYFDAKTFGGLKASTGQFGFRLLEPQDLKTTAAGDTPAYYSWIQTLTTTSAKTYKQYAFGYSSGKVYAKNASNKKAVIAFHRLISYKPAPRLLLVEWNINDYPYVPYAVEPFSKISKNDKLFKVIPMPGRVIIHPGGGFYTHFYFDRETQTLSGTANIDVEIAPLGLVFAEHDYLAADQLT